VRGKIYLGTAFARAVDAARLSIAGSRHRRPPQMPAVFSIQKILIHEHIHMDQPGLADEADALHRLRA
jgi:hypothetical protein